MLHVPATVESGDDVSGYSVVTRWIMVVVTGRTVLQTVVQRLTDSLRVAAYSQGHYS